MTGVSASALLSFDSAPCTSLQAAETVMVRVGGRVAATVCRTAWVRLARGSRAPAGAADTAQKVSTASQRYRARGRPGRALTPPRRRGGRQPGPGAG